MEIWKSIPNYSRYEMSNEYRVRNKKTGHIMKVVTTIYKAPYSKRVGLKHDEGGDGVVYLDNIGKELFALIL